MKYEITGVGVHYGCDGMPRMPRMEGFHLENVAGCVDPFVDGNFMPQELKRFIDDGNIIEGKTDEFIKAELEWGNAQIGKLLECDEIYFRAYATGGHVEITEKPAQNQLANADRFCTGF